MRRVSYELFSSLALVTIPKFCSQTQARRFSVHFLPSAIMLLTEVIVHVNNMCSYACVYCMSRLRSVYVTSFPPLHTCRCMTRQLWVTSEEFDVVLGIVGPLITGRTLGGLRTCEDRLARCETSLKFSIASVTSWVQVGMCLTSVYTKRALVMWTSATIDLGLFVAG